eukprot:CAMPEP_0197663930 /NCGR_PEP_ID=MMETSP1338-20131121/58328_1 /TAXON_ID=43686 ORGANISM="Pelagodinium beii, Strain RCC1491" /NCGR_SAMPLE_ID=MMETSP1338 /ASSEMBLY_ACC=CAM_ASM_000754 /LENGTH=93 /DNA_ID=CAMNT_0043242465 /DNA_START=83 /DNA_END=364 /DNA_ORIENTATION=-
MAKSMRIVSLACVCLLCWGLSMAASFVSSPGLRGTVRDPAVAMEFFGGEPVTTTTTPPPPALAEIEPGTYVLGMSALMILSVAANSKGFFGPW